MRRVPRLFMIAMLMSLTLAACGGGDTAPADAPTDAIDTVPADAPTDAIDTAPPSALPPTAAADVPTNPPTDAPAAAAISEEAVAAVNGVTISRDAFERELARRRNYSLAANEQALIASTLDALIEQEVINQAAVGLGVMVTDAEVQAEVDALIAQAGSADAWETWLGQNLYTQAEIVTATRDQLTTARVREAVLAQADSVPVDPAGSSTVQVRARHILVSTEAEANDVLNRLRTGEDFADLARLYSRDVTTRDSGGDLGFFVRENLTTPELADVALTLSVNEIAGPVQTVLGYHIVQTLEFSDTPTTLDPAQQSEVQFNDWLVTQRASAQIERFLDN